MKVVLSPQDQSIRRRAAMLSVLMHVVLFLGMIFMVDWKAVHVNPSVMEATLWDSLPSKQPSKAVAKPVEPPPPPPEPEPAPKPPEPKPVEKTPAPEPQAKPAEQEAEIALKKREDEKKRLLEEEKKKELEQKKQEEKLKKIQEALRKQEEDEKLKKIQDALRQQDMDAQQAAASAAADPSILSYYMGLMKRKITAAMNPGLCPASNPELLVDIQLTNSGDIAGMPKMVKGSGDAICDDVVLRAILAAKPFDLPDDPATRRKMVDQIRLKFKPRG